MQLKKKRKAPPIPIAAMGDIAFLLLIFYMATTMVTDQKPRTVEVPELAGRGMNSPYPLIIYLDREMADSNSAYFFNKAIPIPELAQQIKERAAFAPAAVRVYLNIERDLPYRNMNAVVESLKDAGVRNLVITTRPEGAGIPKGGPDGSSSENSAGAEGGQL
ncbi:MAG: biopolymer transporter ExbD [bacterium]|nr:biopolymer transporter ExbD [bacterium]